MIAELLFYGSFVAIAWAGHTPRSKRLSEYVEAAIDETCASQKAASIDMGLDQEGAKLSRQIAGTEPLNLWRLAGLPDAFLIAFASRILRSFGYVVLAPQERDFVLSAAQLGIKKMARYAPSIFQRKQAS